VEAGSVEGCAFVEVLINDDIDTLEEASTDLRDAYRVRLTQDISKVSRLETKLS
jgi:hypothetical protein